MTHAEITNLMLEDLKKLASPQHKTMGVRNFPSNMERLGVTSAGLKKVVADWSKILHDYTPKQWVELCLLLSQNEIFECQILAYELLWKNKQALRTLTLQDILALGKRLDNWASVDSYCTMIAGWHWREGTLPDQQIIKWLNSDNHWLRRCAVVCTVPLNLRAKGGTGDTHRTLMVCERVIHDRHDLVIKALSWALRELSKQDRPAVEAFIEEHWKDLHGRVRREVTTKLKTGRKNG